MLRAGVNAYRTPSLNLGRIGMAHIQELMVIMHLLLQYYLCCLQGYYWNKCICCLGFLTLIEQPNAHSDKPSALDATDVVAIAEIVVDIFRTEVFLIYPHSQYNFGLLSSLL